MFISNHYFTNPIKYDGWCQKKFNDISKEIHAFSKHKNEKKKNRVICKNIEICDVWLAFISTQKISPLQIYFYKAER